MEKGVRKKGRGTTDGRSELSDYVEQNRKKLERLAMHGNVVTSAMAMVLLEKGSSGGE